MNFYLLKKEYAKLVRVDAPRRRRRLLTSDRPDASLDRVLVAGGPRPECFASALPKLLQKTSSSP